MRHSLKRLRLICCGWALMSCLGGQAQVRDNACWPSYVSTYYFGPNAFPVPDMKTTTARNLEALISADYVRGHISKEPDRTATVNFSVNVPLWCDRVEFSLWGQAYEWFRDSPGAREERKAESAELLSGNQFGDIYFSISANVLKQSERVPGITMRAACKTASGGHKDFGRYYDAPGYFFDASIFKNFRFAAGHNICVAAQAGLLYWQVKAGSQNDALMYGLSLAYEYSPGIRVSSEFSGYWGWRHDGDSPMVLKIRAIAIPTRLVSPFVEYQHGFRDWPFDLLRAGVAFQVDILTRKSPL